MYTLIALAALALATPFQERAVGTMTTEGGPEDDTMQTEPALRSRIAVDVARNPWRGAGTMAAGKGRRPAPPLRTDYDGDGVTDTLRLVRSRVHAAVLMTSGRTGATRPIWLIDSRRPLGADVHLAREKGGHVTIVFPESTVIYLHDRGGTAMATYLNG